MRLDMLQSVAAFGTQLVLAAGRLLDSSSSSTANNSSSSSEATAADPLAAAALLESPEFLALTVLVLTGQLTATKLAGHAATAAPAAAGVDPSEAGQQEGDGSEEDVQQQQQHMRSQGEELDLLLSTEAQHYCSQVNDFMSLWHPMSRTVVLRWEGAPCWQQHSGSADVRLVLLVLLALLDAATDATLQHADQEHPDVVLMLLHLPVLLLQLSSRDWQQQEVALCLTALQATAAAAECIAKVQEYDNEGSSETTRTLLLQWLQLVRAMLPDSSSSDPAAAAAAAVDTEPTAGQQHISSELLILLVDVLAWSGSLEFDWSCEAQD
jgi:hypothetical protein